MAGLLIGWLTAMVIKPPKELKMHVIVATGLGDLTATTEALSCHQHTAQACQYQYTQFQAWPNLQSRCDLTYLSPCIVCCVVTVVH